MLRRLPDRIFGKVRIPLGRGDLAVTEQPADYVEILLTVNPEAGEGVAQVMYLNFGDFGFVTNPFPHRLKASPVRARLVARDHEDLAFGSFESFENGDGRAVEENCALARLRVGEVETAPLDVYFLPAESEDLG